jgi:UPF0755 protein
MADVGKELHGDDAEDLSARLSSSLGRGSPKSPAEALQPEPVPPPPSRSRAVRHPLVVLFNFVLTIVIVGVVAAGGALFVSKIQFERPGALDQARTFTVESESGLSAIADKLQTEGIVASRWLFVAGVMLNKQQRNLKAGEYLIPAHASMRDIMDTMVSGKGILYSVTIPEGLTSQQIVDRLMAESILVGDVAEIPPEGTLLPDTYKFTRGDTRQSLLDRMRRERDSVLAGVWSHRAPDLPITTPEELVILASIVEKETSLADERSRVAAVFINRLTLNMRLQSDPTVIYALFKGAGKPPGFVLSRADLETRSPYNTYEADRLPPAPIDNPGRASLEAVANPSRTRDLFFVADGNGGHAFAESYEAHLRNVARWREINKNVEEAVAPEGAGSSPDGAAPAAAATAEATPGGEVPAGAEAAAAQKADAPMALSPAVPAAGDGPMQLQPRIRQP